MIRSSVFRDPDGIRTAFYQDDEIVVVASERLPYQTVMNVKTEDIRENCNLADHDH